MVAVFRYLILFLICLVFGWYNPGDLSAGGSLPVRYMAEAEIQDETALDSSFSAGHIDNQAYLRAFEERRRSRASGRSASTAGVVITRPYLGFSFPPRVRENSRWGDNDATFFEYRNGTSSIRYYDGYLPNRCNGSHIYRLPCRTR